MKNAFKSAIFLALALGSSVPLAGLPASAAYPDGFDPIANRCDDARTLTRTSGGYYWYFLSRREIIVELRASNKCKANWTKADVPKGTSIYLKGAQGQSYVPYTTAASGSSYTNMMNWNPPYAACARLPWGQEVCTSLVK